MAGGIQLGTEAGSVESKQLDGDVSRIARAIAQAQNQYVFERGHRNLTSERICEDVRDRAQLPEFTSKNIEIGCVPDGGMWFDGNRDNPNRRLKVVFEAKHQQNAGNAIERWATNRALCLSINPDARYITFATGEGSVENGVLKNYGNAMSVVFPNTEWHYSPDGFTEQEIFEIIRGELNLDLTFDQISRYITAGTDNNFEDLFTMTPEEILADIAKKQIVNNADNHFVSSLQDKTDPLTQAWIRLDSSDKSEARDLIIDLITEGHANSQIASTVIETYIG